MYPLKRIVPSLRNINIFKSTFYPPLKLLKNLIIKSYYKIISFNPPHCNKTLEKIKIRKDFNIYKCKNNYCSFYQYNLAKKILKKKRNSLRLNPLNSTSVISTENLNVTLHL